MLQNTGFLCSCNNGLEIIPHMCKYIQICTVLKSHNYMASGTPVKWKECCQNDDPTTTTL